MFSGRCYSQAEQSVDRPLGEKKHSVGSFFFVSCSVIMHDYVSLK